MTSSLGIERVQSVLCFWQLLSYAKATVTRQKEYACEQLSRARFIVSAMPLHTDQMDLAIMNLEQLKLGLRIRDARKSLGYSQEGFAAACGLDRSYFGGVERGERNVTFGVLCTICTGLTCDIAAVTKGIPHLTEATT